MIRLFDTDQARLGGQARDGRSQERFQKARPLADHLPFPHLHSLSISGQLPGWTVDVRLEWTGRYLIMHPARLDQAFKLAESLRV